MNYAKQNLYNLTFSLFSEFLFSLDLTRATCLYGHILITAPTASNDALVQVELIYEAGQLHNLSIYQGSNKGSNS